MLKKNIKLLRLITNNINKIFIINKPVIIEAINYFFNVEYLTIFWFLTFFKR